MSQIDKTVQDQLQYIGDELGRLEGKTLTTEQIAAAVAVGLERAVSSPTFWTAAIEAMGSRTKTAAGGFLLDGMRSTLKRVMWLLLAGWVVYMAGGWSALAGLFKSVFGIGVPPP
jgi:hypothetical protein